MMLHHLKHNGVLKERVIFLSLRVEEVPTVDPGARIDYTDLGRGFHRVIAHYGFMESPDVPALLPELARFGVVTSPMQTSFFLARETLLASGEGNLAPWRKRLFILMSRNAQSASTFFNLPPNRVVEMGGQIQI